MKIQFEIKESFAEIVEEIFHSDKWETIVKGEYGSLRRVIIKDHYYDSKAAVDVWEHEIHITTAWSNYTYRVYKIGNSVWIEYIGAYRGLLEQKLLPKFTPKGNLLESEVISSSILSKEKDSLLNYSAENAKRRTSTYEQLSNATEQNDLSKAHPKVVHDEFIKIGVPLPPPPPKE